VPHHLDMFDFDVLQLDVPLTNVPRGPAITLAPGTAATSALRAMRDRRRRGVVVVQNHRPLGVVTDRDILGCLSADVADLNRLPLSAVMTPCPQPLRDTDTIATALRRMSAARQWHQPIVCRRGLMLGALDVADIAPWLCDQLTMRSIDAYL
jgi:CBS domain-containing protein